MNRFTSLPAPAQAGFLIFGGGSLIGAVYYMFGSQYMLLLIVALVVAGLSLLVYKLILNWRDKKKSKPFEAKLAENTGATPQGVTDATRRARVDDLRRKFDEGIKTFREHGKDIYSLPWYALVGEPGSGKTEAVRHSNVGFPPGLQDQLQGSGGTLNMNWWFTNNAVILDTAGRLMFEEVEAGKTNEWKEFLKLLKIARPNCPINGLLLVIPADSLITDSPSDITSKAGKIAEQLDSIQRILGVRFPAFVVITKSDLINGFREFFADMTEPQQQYQMLGWSNPTDLDSPFRPEDVEQHIKEVSSRLRERRLSVLLDPVHTEDPLDGRRIDEVDAMYAFPDALMNIAPRLKLYLETVFVPGEWSTKPLFLRGIYFTSSLQEGAELDAELASAMGVDVKSLPGGGFRRSVSLFLRDLFSEKVFKEKGLVTNATNARQQQKRRKMMVLGGLIAGVLAMIGVTWFNGQQFESSIGEPTSFWTAVSEVATERPASMSVLSGDNAVYQWVGEGRVEGVTVEGSQVQAAQLPGRTLDRALSKAYTPIMYRPVLAATDDIWAGQKAAHETVLRAALLDPLVRAVRERFELEPVDIRSRDWRPQASESLSELILLRAGIPSGESPLKLRPLTAFALASDTRAANAPESVEGQLSELESVLIRTYGPGESSLQLPWPPQLLGVNPDGSGASLDGAISSGVNALLRRWPAPDASGSSLVGSDGLGPWEALAEAAEAFAEQDRKAILASQGFENVQTLEQFNDRKAQWNFSRVGAGDAGTDGALSLDEAKRRLDAALEATGPIGTLSTIESTLNTKLREAREQRLARLRTEFDVVLSAYEQAQIDPVRDASYRQLKQRYEDLTKAASDQESRLRARLANAEVRARLVQTDAGVPMYRLRHQIFKIASDELDRPAPSPGAEALDVALNTIAGEARTARTNIDNVTGLPAEERSALRDASRFVINAAGRWRSGEAYKSALASLEGARIEDLVVARAPEPEAFPPIPFTDLAPQSGSGPPPRTQEKRYSPEGAKAVFDLLSSLQRAPTPGSASGQEIAVIPLDADRLTEVAGGATTRLDAYRRDYFQYWLVTVYGYTQPRIPVGWGWAEIQENLARIRVGTTSDDIRAMHQRIGRAILAAADTPAGQESLEMHVRLDGVAKNAAQIGLSTNQRAALEQIQRELKLLADSSETDALLTRVTSVLSAWRLLGTDVSRARQAIWTDTNAFGRLFDRVWDDRAPKVRYWSSLLETALDGLGASWQAASGNLVGKLIIDAGFPIHADSNQPMTWERLVSSYTDAASLSTQATPIPGAGESPADPKLPSTVSGLGTQGVTQRQKDWMTKVAAQLKPLCDGGVDKIPTAELRLLAISDLPPTLQQEYRVATNVFRRIRVLGVMPDAVPSEGDAATAAIRLGGVYRAEGQPIELLFYESVDDPKDTQTGPEGKVAERIQLPRPWSALDWLLRSEGSIRLDASGLGAQGWRAAPLRVGTHTYWIGIRLVDATGQPIPIDPQRWLKTADAPGAGG